MKPISLAVLVSFLSGSGLALSAQSDEQKERHTVPSRPMMQNMMKEGKSDMMKGRKEGEHMGEMMGMMRMMEQCSKMMESAQTDSGNPKESRM
jgi:hypothetical protein